MPRKKKSRKRAKPSFVSHGMIRLRFPLFPEAQAEQIRSGTSTPAVYSAVPHVLYKSPRQAVQQTIAMVASKVQPGSMHCVSSLRLPLPLETQAEQRRSWVPLPSSAKPQSRCRWPPQSVQETMLMLPRVDHPARTHWVIQPTEGPLPRRNCCWGCAQDTEGVPSRERLGGAA